MERRGSRGVTSRRVATKSPPRNKSPSRKSPSRKSPSRKVEPIKEEPAVKGRPRGRPKVVPSQPKSASPKNDLHKVSLSPIKHETGRSSVHTKTTTTTTSSSVKVSQISNESDDEVKRLISSKVNYAKEKLDGLRYTPTPSELSRHSRLSHSRSMSRSILDDEDADEYSDGEQGPIHNEDLNKFTYRTDAKKPVGTASIWIGLAVLGLIVLISVVGFYLPFSCTREKCAFTIPKIEKLQSLKTWEPFVYYPLYIGAVLLLSAIPIGTTSPVRNEHPPIFYRFNGLIIGVIIGAAVAVAEYLKYPVVRFIYANYSQFCAAAIVYALLVAGWRYLLNRDPQYEFKWNPYAKSGSFWKDYFIGREVNPRWLRFDIKLIHYNAAIIATLLLNGIFIYRNLKFSPLPMVDGKYPLTLKQTVLYVYSHLQYDSVALMFAGLQSYHALDLLHFERHLQCSFFLQGEGVGAFLLLQHALYPFLNSLVSKYSWEHRMYAVPTWAMSLTTVLFLFGLFVKRRSNLIKSDYRLDENDERYCDAEKIQTYQNRKLLLCGYWGLVRQPNYTGDIISYLALTIPLYWHFAWPPFIALLLPVVHLILRGKQVSHRNNNRYNSSWARYCKKVPHILIPKVY